MRGFRDEVLVARREHRKPRCPHCGELLSIGTTELVLWQWNTKAGRFEPENLGDDLMAPFPRCASCGVESLELLDLLESTPEE